LHTIADERAWTVKKSWRSQAVQSP
jgi:hypothetical protein